MAAMIRDPAPAVGSRLTSGLTMSPTPARAAATEAPEHGSLAEAMVRFAYGRGGTVNRLARMKLLNYPSRSKLLWPIRRLLLSLIATALTFGDGGLCPTPSRLFIRWATRSGQVLRPYFVDV